MNTYDTYQVAFLLEVDVSTVLRCAKNGKLRPINADTRKGGEPYRFDVEDIVKLPRTSDYYTNLAAYKFLRSNGVAPFYTNKKSANVYMQRLVHRRKLRATKSAISGYFLFDLKDLEHYVRQTLKAKGGELTV